MYFASPEAPAELEGAEKIWAYCLQRIGRFVFPSRDISHFSVTCTLPKVLFHISILFSIVYSNPFRIVSLYSLIYPSFYAVLSLLKYALVTCQWLLSWQEGSGRLPASFSAFSIIFGVRQEP